METYTHMRDELHDSGNKTSFDNCEVSKSKFP